MFIKLKKNCGILMQHNGMDKNLVLPVSSNVLINLNHVSEASFYTIKEDKQRFDLKHSELTIPQNTKVIHLSMNYRFASHSEHAAGGEQNVDDRSFYKVYFFGESMAEYECIRSYIDSITCNH